MTTSLKPFGRRLKRGRKKGRKSFENYGWSGRPKDENFKVMHTLIMCHKRRDLRSISSEVGKKKFCGGGGGGGGSAINLNQHLRYVKGFGRMGAWNVEG